MNKAESKKMDILLSFRKKGYNLKDTEDPAVLSMELGNGYTLLASVKREWLISFDDGVQKTTYQVDSVKVPFTNAKDAQKLYKEFLSEAGEFDKEHRTPKKNKPTAVKNNGIEDTQTTPGTRIPIVYPQDMIGSFMLFKQWTANNNVIPEGSGVVILNETEYGYQISITKACINFDIKKDKVEVVQA